MKLLDLFCGAGGAAMGYSQAGFDEIVGVDIAPQPNYPFEFVQMNALDLHGQLRLGTFDLIHASPPCQAFTSMRTMPNAGLHQDLLSPTRALLHWRQVPFVIENVVGAPMPSATRLCGGSFGLRSSDGYQLRRHRHFETSFFLMSPGCFHPPGPVIGFYGDHARNRSRVGGSKDRGSDILGEDKMRLVRELMGIDWMEWEEAKEAIPPAYTKFIGEQFLLQQVVA